MLFQYRQDILLRTSAQLRSKVLNVLPKTIILKMGFAKLSFAELSFAELCFAELSVVVS